MHHTTGLNNFYDEISILIAKELSGEITVDEQDKLHKWRLAHRSHENCYERIRRRLERGQTKLYYNKAIIQADWKKVRQQISEENIRWKRIWRWGRYAAIIVCMIGGIWKGFEVEQPETSLIGYTRIEPGKVRAVLTLANGEQVGLYEQKQDSIRSEGVLIASRSGQLIYDSCTNTVDKELYNTVKVPQGGEYRITLSDGTKVWINAKTSLTYPVTFMGKERNVKLSGEAYFEVKENIQKPFTVTTDELVIKVLGTSFNVNAYPDEENVVTTLLEGSVQLENQEQLLNVLHPSEQAVWSRSAKELQIREVKASDFIQWREGDFSFWNDDLETIMRVLARWYDMEYEFEQEELKAERFYGVINRYVEVGELLNQFEKTGKVHFQYQGKIIRIKK